MNTRRLLSCIVLALSSLSLYAQGPILWRQTNGPIGGNVTSICIDSSQVLTISTQVAGFFRSTNNGETWFNLNKGIKRLQGKQVASDGVEYTYASTYYGGDFLRNKGTEIGWEYISPFPALAYNTIFTDILVNKKKWVYTAAGKFGIFRSKDHGDTWERPGLNIKDSVFARMAMNKDGKLYAVTQGYGTVFSSTDDGDTWTKLPTPVPSYKNSANLSFTLSANDDLIVGQGYGALYRSSDQGQTWVKVFQHPNSHNIEYMVRSDKTGHLLITTFSNLLDSVQSHLGGIFISTDDGVSWKLQDQTEHGDTKFYLAVNRNGEVFHASVPAGVLKSNDEGQTWKEKNAGIFAQFMSSVVVNSKGDVFSATQFGAYRSQNSGDTWFPLDVQTQESVRAPFLRMAANDILYHGSYFGLYRSSNNGDSWVHILKVDPIAQHNIIYDMKEAPWGDVFVATINTGLMTSNDHGLTFHKAPNINPPNTIFTALACAKKDTVIASAEGTSFYRSVNGGYNWDLISNENIGCKAIEAHPEGSFIGLFSSYVGRSLDGGVTWPKIFPPSQGLDSTRSWSLYSIYIDRNDGILVTTDSGIYRSKVAPYETWEFVAVGLTAPDFLLDHYTNVSELAQNKSTGVFFAAARGQSVYRSTVDLAVRAPFVRDQSQPDQNYPNPFPGFTNINFTLTTAGNVSVEVFDLLGRSIGVLLNERREVGSYSIPFNGQNLPAGNYLYVVRTGDSVKKNWMTLTK